MTEHEHAEVTVSMPLSLTRDMMRAIKEHPTTSCETEGEFHTKLGWLICAWDVLLEHRRNSIIAETPSSQQSQPLTDEQYLELLLRTGSKELLHYTAFVNDTLQGRWQIQLLKSAKDIRDFVEAAHGIKKGVTK